MTAMIVTREDRLDREGKRGMIETEGAPLDASELRRIISEGFGVAKVGRDQAQAVKDRMAARACRATTAAVNATSPSPERMRRGKVLHPETTRDTRRETYRALDEVEAAHRKGDIGAAELDAWTRFQRHYAGAQGADVRFDYGTGLPADVEDRRTYHAQHLNRAREALLAREFDALEDLVEGRRGLADIGRDARATAKRETARGQGLVFVQTALARLVRLWG